MVGRFLMSFESLTGDAPSQHLPLHGCVFRSTQSLHHHRAGCKRILVGCPQATAFSTVPSYGWNHSRRMAICAVLATTWGYAELVREPPPAGCPSGNLAVGPCQASRLWCCSRHGLFAQRQTTCLAPRPEICEHSSRRKLHCQGL
jgi:hypothetical protein